MNKFASWIKAARLRTLPLAVAGILLGSILAFLDDIHFKPMVLLLATTTAVLLQILSNLANDYGDYIKGTDAIADRKDRTLNNGEISPKQMKTALFVITIVTFISGIWLLLEAFGNLQTGLWFFLGLGIAAIVAAIGYTVGKRAYGYYGLGDLFVFLFFGPIAVFGTYYLHLYEMPTEAIPLPFAPNPLVLIPGFGMGLFSVAVLNINNIRDIESDAKAGKNTLAVKLGFTKAMQYQHFLVIGAILLFAIYTASLYFNKRIHWFAFLYLPLAQMYLFELKTLRTIEDKQNKSAFTTRLKALSQLHLLWVTLFGLAMLIGSILHLYDKTL